MESSTKKRRLLFLNTDPRNPTTQRGTRSKSLDSKVRRHLMVDIGMSRRKPSKTPQFDTFVWSLAEASETLSRRNAMSSGEDTQVYHGLQFSPLLLIDWDTAHSTNIFWFPFAFRKSPFLHHYQEIFTSPNVLIPLYSRSNRKLRSLALERSLETIQCIESRLSSSDASSATSDNVLYAVLALVCYNFTNLDFDQAMIHVKGMWMVIATRGGMSTLEANQDLMLMISWVDITTALLHDTKPLFPIFAARASASVFHNSGLQTLLVPLLSVIKDGNTQNTQFMNVMSVIGDLNALGAHFRFEPATKVNTTWDDGEEINFLVNPVTHKLLDQPLTFEPVTRWDIVSDALRLGAMIWIIRVKRRCRSYPGTAEARISRLLKILSSKSKAGHVWNSPDLSLVRLWLLVLCSISGPTDKDLVTSMEMIASEMKGPRSVSWDRIMADIRQMPWIDIFEPLCAELGKRLLKDHLKI
ncbi:hypothetical protein AK830_g1318 [Neonectria ditissima]|uniref:Transcription factor domain-containing protein n=1 Tax=Neonectria ditissima TaxID=78410 RepID=A0A0P7BN03_9HYPO|nr:hypothetical protein AK830_g1318 [Neonectria ditissima]